MLSDRWGHATDRAQTVRGPQPNDSIATLPLQELYRGFFFFATLARFRWNSPEKDNVKIPGKKKTLASLDLLKGEERWLHEQTRHVP